jgi:hypothetical protein
LPSSLMETLDAAAFGSEPYQISPAEINLILNAERWLFDNGWEPHHVRGWSNVGRAFGQDNGFNGLVIRERRRGFWDGDGVRHPVRSVVAGLNILVNEEILPARFSTHGSKALADFAEALDRAAERLVADQPSGFPYDPSLTTEAETKAEALRHAAEVAREHNPIAVFS